MKIKRFVAPDMRTALTLVRQEHGPDAVILSNRMTDDGVEIVAASNYDEALVQRTLDAMRPAAEVAIAQAPTFARPAAAPREHAQARADALHRPSDRADAPLSPAEAAAAYFQRGTLARKDATAASAQPAAPAQEAPAATPAPVARKIEPTLDAFDEAPVPRKPRAPRGEDLDALPAFLRESLRNDSKGGDARTSESLYAGIPAPAPLASEDDIDFDLDTPAATFTVDPNSFAARLAASLPTPPAAEASVTITSPQSIERHPRAGADPATLAQTPAMAAKPESAITLAVDNTAAAQQTRESDEQLAQMRAELAAMRGMIEDEMHRLTDERLKGSPVRAQAMELLEDYGFDAGITRDVALQIPADTDLHRGRGLMLGLLSKKLPILAQDPLETGGVIALVGPTGAGKTTTIAKLAAAFADRHNPRDVALVTTDTVRVGGREQLHSYGRQLGIAVHEADSDVKLAQVLERLRDYKLVLIDTAGLGQRDKNLVGQLNWLRAAGQIHTLLCLPANSHFADLDEVVRRFSGAQPKGVVLTKVDETGRLGSPLSVIVDHQLPMAWITDGQRVPEDLHRASAPNLVLRLDQLRREADEAIPAGQFDSERHHVA